jgi:hypothetical protein
MVRVATIRGGGVGVVLDREAKVPRGCHTGLFRDVLPRAQEFDDGQGQVGKTFRVGLAFLDEERIERH